jgi:YHS domain-containing protein
MLIRFLLVLFVLYLLYRVTKGILRLANKKSDRSPERPPPLKGEDLVEDPYCHTYVPISDAYRETIEGQTMHFCSRECSEKYKQKMEAEKARS